MAGMDVDRLMEFLSRFAFATASLLLMAMSLALVVFGCIEVLTVGAWRDASDALLGAIGYLVISMAVFDVAKYFIEEEVIRGREMRSAAEARRSLTKFISTIAIAVFIEGLLIVFRTSHHEISEMMYPIALLVTAILIVIGLGFFQYMSAQAELVVEPEEGS